MAFNSFGQYLKFSTWGESHGECIGCLIDGVPSGVPFNEEILNSFLCKRRPGSGEFTSPRNETDDGKILSGVFRGETTGAPVSILIKNIDAKSKDYSLLEDVFRPGHADYTVECKYGIRDHNGGGRSSARETAARVAASSLAMQILPKSVHIYSAVIRIGKKETNKIDTEHLKKAHSNPLKWADESSYNEVSKYLSDIKITGDSIGGKIILVASGVPCGLGEPTYYKIDAVIAYAMMGINAVKGVEIGSGFDASKMLGSENSDEMFIENGKPKFKTNNAGGCLGGISTGEDIVVKLSIKATPSSSLEKSTIDRYGNEIKLKYKGRHDTCIAIRATIVAEAMLSFTIADLFLLNKARKTKP